MAPPRLAAWLARVLLRLPGGEHIVGDLEELYVLRRDREGRARAGRRYVRDVLGSVVARLRPARRPRSAGSPNPTQPPRRVLLSDMPADFCLALRSLIREPGFSVAAVLTLALGIGAVSAVFGVANQLVLRPLPGVPNTGSAAYLRFRLDTDSESMGSQRGIALVDFDALRSEASLLDGVASYGLLRPRLSQGGQRPVYVWANTIYGDFFDVLGVRPAAGRLLRADETDIDASPLRAVISERLWATQFGRDVDPVGRTLVLNDQPVTVIGVAGDGFRGPERGSEIDVWIPHNALVPLLAFPRERLLDPYAVMHGDVLTTPAEGASPSAVEAQVALVLEREAAESDPEHARYLARLRPTLFPGLNNPPLSRQGTRATVLLFGGVGTLVLLIACANVANLLLGRNLARRAAVATRRALGASEARVARELFTRSVVLGALGVVLGVVVAWVITLLFRGQNVGRVTLEGFALDWRVISFSAALCVVSTMLFGTVPALLAGRFSLEAELRAAGDRSTRRVSALGVAISAGQLALTLTLLVGAMLLARTVHNLYAADLGLNLDRLSELWVEVPDGLSGPDFDGLSQSVLASVKALPEVEDVALSNEMPYVRSGFRERVRPVEAPDSEPALPWAFGVTPGWFDLFGIDAIRGRTLRDRDREPDTPRPVVLSAAFARSLLGGIDVIGRRLLIGTRSPEEFEVVGVVEDSYGANGLDAPLEAFFVTTGTLVDRSQLVVFTRTSSHGTEVTDRIRSAVRAVVPHIPLDDPAPVSDRIDTVHRERRILSRLLALLSAFAIVLSAVGLYGIVAFDVAARRREFGIRSAVGAQGRHIARLVARYAAAIVVLGSLLGLGGGYALSRILESRLFRVAPLDPISYLAAVAMLATATAVACLLPTLRATRVDPMATLKSN